MEEYKSTITLKECVSVMRDMGISTSESTISLGIAQGVLPFGIAIGMEKSRVLMISKKLFTEWCETFCGRTPDFSPYMSKPQQYIYGYTLEEWNSMSEEAQIAIEQRAMLASERCFYDT